MQKLISFFVFLIFVFSFSKYSFSADNPYEFDSSQNMYSYAGGEGPLSLPPGSDKELVKQNKNGIAKFIEGNYKVALEEFETAEKVDPSSAIIIFNEAITLDRLDRVKDAILRFQQAKDLAGGDPLIVGSPILQTYLE